MKPVRTVEVCIDVVDPGPVAGFWTEFLGYATTDDVGGRWVHLEPPPGLPVLNLQRVPERKELKNRLHLDVYVDDPSEWIEHAERLGATQLTVHDDPQDWFCVMADPAGNEFCVCLEGDDGGASPTCPTTFTSLRAEPPVATTGSETGGVTPVSGP